MVQRNSDRVQSSSDRVQYAQIGCSVVGAGLLYGKPEFESRITREVSMQL
jgi:hypothetical protein